MKKIIIILAFVFLTIILTSCGQESIISESSENSLENNPQETEVDGGGGEVAGEEDTQTAEEVPLAGESH